MEPRTVGLDPHQRFADLSRRNSSNDGQTIKLDRAFAPITQLNVKVKYSELEDLRNSPKRGTYLPHSVASGAAHRLSPNGRVSSPS